MHTSVNRRVEQLYTNNCSIKAGKIKFGAAKQHLQKLRSLERPDPASPRYGAKSLKEEHQSFGLVERSTKLESPVQHSPTTSQSENGTIRNIHNIFVQNQYKNTHNYNVNLFPCYSTYHLHLPKSQCSSCNDPNDPVAPRLMRRRPKVVHQPCLLDPFHLHRYGAGRTAASHAAAQARGTVERSLNELKSPGNVRERLKRHQKPI